MTFTVPDEVARRLQAAAVARGVPVDQAVVEGLTDWTEHHAGELPELSFVGIGEGRADLAEHHDGSLSSISATPRDCC